MMTISLSLSLYLSHLSFLSFFFFLMSVCLRVYGSIYLSPMTLSHTCQQRRYFVWQKCGVSPSLGVGTCAHDTEDTSNSRLSVSPFHNRLAQRNPLHHNFAQNVNSDDCCLSWHSLMSHQWVTFSLQRAVQWKDRQTDRQTHSQMHIYIYIYKITP